MSCRVYLFKGIVIKADEGQKSCERIMGGECTKKNGLFRKLINNFFKNKSLISPLPVDQGKFLPYNLVIWQACKKS